MTKTLTMLELIIMIPAAIALSGCQDQTTKEKEKHATPSGGAPDWHDITGTCGGSDPIAKFPGLTAPQVVAVADDPSSTCPMTMTDPNGGSDITVPPGTTVFRLVPPAGAEVTVTCGKSQAEKPVCKGTAGLGSNGKGSAQLAKGTVAEKDCSKGQRVLDLYPRSGGSYTISITVDKDSCPVNLSADSNGTLRQGNPLQPVNGAAQLKGTTTENYNVAVSSTSAQVTMSCDGASGTGSCGYSYSLSFSPAQP